MKKKIFSIGMIVVLVLSSMLLTATPASAADLAFSTLGIPAGVPFYQLGGGTDVSYIKVAPNGDIFAVDTAPAGADLVYKSTNGGRTWTPSAAINADLVDLEISPSYETDSTVIITSATQVYISTNGGATFAVLGGPITGGGVTSLAISPTYSGGTGEVMVGTTGTPDIYIWGRLAVQNWTAQGLTENVLDVAFSPNYPIDATLLAVSVNGTPATNLHSRVSTLGWDATIGGAVNIANTSGNIAAASASMAIPSDFNSSLPQLRTVYVAANSPAGDDKIHRVVAGDALGVASTLLDPSALTADDQFTTLAYSGTGAMGTLFAGTHAAAAANTPQVYRSDNPGATIVTWSAALTPPTGTSLAAGALTYLALAEDFASSNKIYAGTVGTDSALSVSDDGGMYFYQTGLIDTAIATIQDFQAASSSEFFMLTSEGGAAADSVWKTADGGLSWYRVLATVLTNNTGILRLSPDYGTDSTLYLANTGAAATGIQLSNDGGNTWVPRMSPVAIADLAVKDMYSIYVGDVAGANIFSSNNGGFFWGPPGAALTGGDTVNDVKIDLGTGHLLVSGAAGNVGISYDNGTNWTPLGVGVATTCAFDANYDSNDTIYGIIVGTAGVARRTTAPTDAFVAIDGGVVGAVANGAADILVAPDGSVYVTDLDVAAIGAGGMWRSIAPTAPAIPGTFGVAASWQEINAVALSGLTAGDVLTTLAYAEGSNILYTIQTAVAPAIRTYTDTLSAVAPEQTSPAEGTIIASATTAMLMWNPVAGATAYQVQLDTRSDFATSPTGAGNPAGITAVVAAPLSSTVQGVVAGFTYYWRVRVSAPVFGPWSQAMTFDTQLAPANPNAPAILGPAAGGTNAGGYNAPLMPTFQWQNVPRATGYEFQLATDSTMSNIIVEETLTTTAYQATMALDYSTTYYWRVRGVSDTTETAWSPIIAFTTMDEPAPPSEGGGDVTVNVPTQEPPEIVIPTQPAPQITVTTEGGDGAPAGYIWAVIIIGAVLVIALIVLIVRTRRTV